MAGRSKDKIEVTHVGSMPRTPRLTELLLSQERGEAIDEAEFWREANNATRNVVQKQFDCGITIGNDGEQPRVGFQTYMPMRMDGFGGATVRGLPTDFDRFPKVAELVVAAIGNSKAISAPQALADVKYADMGPIEKECSSFQQALDRVGHDFNDVFMNVPSPGIIATTMGNAYYATHDAYVMAVAKEIGKEYRYVVDQGFSLQVDAPDLAMERAWFFKDEPISKFKEITELHVAAINEAIGDIPREKVRLHACWGNWNGPHADDVDLVDVVNIFYGANVSGLSLPFGNPRHEHEISVLKKVRLPDHMDLFPGVIDTTTNYMEHPEVVARRLNDAIDAVGDKERVIASTDCGFSTFAGYRFCAEDAMWIKLKALAEGAAILSKRLW
jgi:5-methyltetrahydropteroyltriglutamate--homocysteine methyltransferase